MSLYNWAIFIIGFINIQIFYFVYKIGVKYLYIAQDHLKDDNSKNTFLK